MSSASSRTVPNRLAADDWAEQVQRMDPADLRLLALTLPVIEQAKGIVMGHYGCGAAAAFEILRQWSSVHDIKVRELAVALVDEASRADGQGESSSSVERFLRTRALD